MNSNTKAWLYCTKGELCEAIAELSRDLAAARRQIEELRVSRAKILGEGIRAIEERDAARLEKTEMRERTIEECVNVLADLAREIDSAIHHFYRSGYRQGIDAAEDAIRDLVLPGGPHTRVTDTRNTKA